MVILAGHVLADGDGPERIATEVERYRDGPEGERGERPRDGGERTVQGQARLIAPVGEPRAQDRDRDAEGEEVGGRQQPELHLGPVGERGVREKSEDDARRVQHQRADELGP